ncbi:hypothetical protein J6590_014368 [Homalodisca vitripennis]|nr:hypothetical protein J6590_014368 [Homalodisca vitripennis]
MLYTCLILSAVVLQSSCYQFQNGGLHREVRQLNLGGLFNQPVNQQNSRGPSCQGPGRQGGRCVPIDQCVLKELNDDYVKNKGYLCALRPEGPVGVCCPNSIKKPVVYQEGMFGNKTTVKQTGGKNNTRNATPEDVELI